MLARAACDNLHQIIFIVQSETAAEEISRLNGDNTKISPQQMPGTFYRWSEDQTRALLNCLDMQKLLKKRRKPADGGAEEVDVLDGLMAEVLEELKIPDAYGCWRPRSTKRHIMTGDRPTAPLPIRGWAHQDSLVTRQGCCIKNAELIGVSFSILYSKEVLDGILEHQSSK